VAGGGRGRAQVGSADYKENETANDLKPHDLPASGAGGDRRGKREAKPISERREYKEGRKRKLCAPGQRKKLPVGRMVEKAVLVSRKNAKRDK